MFRELASLKDEVASGVGRGERGQSLLPSMGVATPPKKAGKKRVTLAVNEERYKEEELDELFSSSDQSESVSKNIYFFNTQFFKFVIGP